MVNELQESYGLGWVKLWRGMVNWEWYTDHVVLSAFIHCILKATHRPKKYRGIELKTGMFITGIEKFGLECGLSPKQVRRAWGCLESTGEIITKRGKMGTVVTVCKYESYQTNGEQEGKIRARKGQDKGKIRATNKNINNIKKEKKYIPDSSEFKEYALSKEPKAVSDFDLFWDRYHSATGKNKTSKAGAEKHWNRLSPAERKQAIDRLETWVSAQSDDPEFICKARTYLSDKRFNDEVESHTPYSLPVNS